MTGRTQEIHTNIWGTLKPRVTILNDWNADYAYNTQALTGKFNINSCIMPNDYLLVNFNLSHKIAIRCKVTYLGHYKNATASEDTTYIIEPLVVTDKEVSSQDFLILYPNPNNGEFQITCTDVIQSIIIYSNKGEKILDIEDVNENNYEVKLILKSGTYLVHVLTLSNNIYNKQIIVL